MQEKLTKLKAQETFLAQLLKRIDEKKVPPELKNEVEKYQSETQILITSHTKWLRIITFYISYLQLCATFHRLVKSTFENVDRQILINLTPQEQIEALKVLKNDIHASMFLNLLFM